MPYFITDKCVGCGICESVCPLHAIHMKAEEISGETLADTKLVKNMEQKHIKKLDYFKWYQYFIYQ